MVMETDVRGGVQGLPEGPESASLALALKLSDLSEEEALALALRQSHTELQAATAAGNMGSSLPLPWGAVSSSSTGGAGGADGSSSSYESDEAMLQAALTLSMQVGISCRPITSGLRACGYLFLIMPYVWNVSSSHRPLRQHNVSISSKHDSYNNCSNYSNPTLMGQIQQHIQ